jgi:hypothetical protein
MAISFTFMAKFRNLFSIFSNEICNETGVGKIYLCPRCLNGGCGYEILQNSCLYSRLTHVFDNTATVIFAIFMSFWGKKHQSRSYFSEIMAKIEIFSNHVSGAVETNAVALGAQMGPDRGANGPGGEARV